MLSCLLEPSNIKGSGGVPICRFCQDNCIFQYPNVHTAEECVHRFPLQAGLRHHPRGTRVPLRPGGQTPRPHGNGVREKDQGVLLIIRHDRELFKEQ